MRQVEPFFSHFITPNFLFNRFSSYGFDDCKATADWLLAQTDIRPVVGIVCGSGLGGLADMLKDQVVFNYKDIPNFPQSTGESRRSPPEGGPSPPRPPFPSLADCFAPPLPLQYTGTPGGWCSAP